jgi:hypothetical protein
MSTRLHPFAEAVVARWALCRNTLLVRHDHGIAQVGQLNNGRIPIEGRMDEKSLHNEN